MGEEGVAKYIAEFIGTFLLVFTVGCNQLTNPAWAVTSIACVLMVSIYALGGVSGANFNPAVSIALGITGEPAGGLKWMDVGIYCVVQLIAGVCAAFAYVAFLWQSFNLAPMKGYGWWQVGLVEMLYTFMLVFVVLNCAVAWKNKGTEFFGLAIGFVIVAGGYAGGHISGGCFNPAVALGIDLSSALNGGFGWCLLYIGFEVLGAVIAAALFWVVRPDNFNGSPVYNITTKLVSEFLGTFFLVLTVGLNVLGGSQAPVWSIAAALMSMIFALGNVSGAHFNPAVTVAIMLCGRKKLTEMWHGGAYIGAQLLGGIAAGFTFSALEGKTMALEPMKGFGWAHAAAAEIIFTFVLCTVVLSVATVEKPLSEFFGLAIGSCVTAGGYAIGHISGGSLNPAVSVGISLSHVIQGGLFYNCLFYSLFEFIGAGLAAAVFFGTHPSEFPKSSSRKKLDLPDSQ